MKAPDSVADLLDRLATSAGTYDKVSAATASEELICHIRAVTGPIEETVIKSAMALLRKMKAFDLMAELADAAIAGGQTSPTVLRQYAQALIETGRLTAAEAVLQGLLHREVGHAELAEASGLLGRVNKQRFVDIGDPNGSGAQDALDAAISAYLDVYQQDKRNTWHGINAVALMARGRRVGIKLDGPDHLDMAREILGQVRALWLDGSANGWDAATAMEAAVAIGDIALARTWLVRYTESPAADGFGLSSAIRQLQQLWEIEDKSEMGEIVHVLRAHAIDRGDGASVEATAIADSASFERNSGGLEKTFGKAGAVTVRWWLQAQDRLLAIARIEDLSGEPAGTGFLVDGGDFSDEWSGEVLLLTNAHVVSREFSTALLPEESWVDFTQDGTEDRHKVADILFESDPYDLDCAVLRLESIPDGVKPLPMAARLPASDGQQRVYVMGHPRGGELKISIDDNVLIDHDDVKVHYKAPTEQGSSGSPVFDRTWQLIALHHSGRDDMARLRGEKGTYPANEGLSLGAIRSRLGPDEPAS